MSNQENEAVDLFGADSLPFESLEEEVKADVEDVQMAVVASAKKATTNAYTDVAVVALERVAKGSLVIRNHSAGEVATGSPVNNVETQILGSVDGGKTFDFTVLAVEGTFTAPGTNRIQEFPHTSSATLPGTLTHVKVQARADVGGAQGTVSVKGAFSMQG